jgi:RNA polymerase sigma-70 factor (ECF subfamily)
VHRASAARYLTRAREALRAALLGELEARLRVTPSELDSIVRLAQSELEISLGRVFRTPDPSTA